MPLNLCCRKSEDGFSTRAANDNICLAMDSEILHVETVQVLRLKRSSSSRHSCDMYFQTLMQHASGTRYMVKQGHFRQWIWGFRCLSLIVITIMWFFS